MTSSNERLDTDAIDSRITSDEVAFFERVVQYQDGTLRDASLMEFDAELRNDPRKQRLFAEIQMQSAMVREILRGEAFRFSQDEVDSLVDEATSPLVAERPDLGASSTMRRRFPKSLVAAAVAVVLLVIGVTWWQQRSVPVSMERGVALLSRGVDLDWVEGGVARSVGAVLEPGMLRLKSGAALIEFYSGARVVVEGPAEFELVSAGEGYLHAGRISAHVPPPARGFTVRTAQFDVIDRGTEFGIAVDREADASTGEIHVFTGLVEVQKSSGVQKLESGEAVRHVRDEVVELASDQSAFLREDELQAKAAAAERLRFNLWDVASGELHADPVMVFHESMKTDMIEQGTVVGCQWTEGRWPHKSALLFRRSADRLRVEVESPLQQATLLAWVRIDSLSRGMNVLLAVEQQRVGSLNWLVNERGQLRLEVGRDLGKPELDWEAVNGEPVVVPERFGEWLFLATTFDRTTIRHFMNGKPCGSGVSFQPPELQIGIAEVGNGHAPAMQHLFGAIDEFAIVGRVMTEAELQNYFDKGRP